AGALSLRVQGRESVCNYPTPSPKMRHGFRTAVFAVCLALGCRTANASTLTVAAGGDVQAALDRAQPGDTVLLEAGATFVGRFTLPVKQGSAYITVRSSAPDSSLPGDGVRM